MPGPGPGDAAAIDADPVRCFDLATSQAMVAEIDAAKKAGDTLGGVVEVLAFGLPPGLGSFTHWDRRLDARLAGALMSIQAIKGVEVGDGFTHRRNPAAPGRWLTMRSRSRTRASPGAPTGRAASRAG